MESSPRNYKVLSEGSILKTRIVPLGRGTPKVCCLEFRNFRVDFMGKEDWLEEPVVREIL